MIGPEILEEAEKNGYYEYEINVAYEINMTKYRIREESPNSYTFIEDYKEHFVIENNILKPKYDEIIVKNIEDGHHIGYGPNEKVFDVNMVVYVNGELKLNDDNTEVLGGKMNVEVIFER